MMALNNLSHTTLFCGSTKKREDETRFMEKHLVSIQVLYSGTSYIRIADKNVTVLHHGGGWPIFYFHQ